jgi:hypothetical protein
MACGCSQKKVARGCGNGRHEYAVQRRNQSPLFRIQRSSVVDRGECRLSDTALSHFQAGFGFGRQYNTKVIEFANANTEAAFAFAQKLSGVKSPTEFIELSTDHSRKQFETLTEQTKELAALAQNVTLAAAEPLKTGVTKAFSQLG